MLLKKQVIDIAAKAEAALLHERYDLRFAFASAVPWAGRPDGDDDGGSGAGTGDSDDGNDDDSSGAGGTDDNAGSDVKDPKLKALSDENAKWRNEKKAEKERADALEAKLREIEDKDKSELEKAQRDAVEFKAKAEKAEARAREMSVELAFFKGGAAALFHDASDALRLIDLGDISPDDEGKIDVKAIKAKADELLKQKPYLARKEGDGENSGGSGGDSPSGRPNNGKKSKDQVDYEALAKKFPALRR